MSERFEVVVHDDKALYKYRIYLPKRWLPNIPDFTAVN